MYIYRPANVKAILERGTTLVNGILGVYQELAEGSGSGLIVIMNGSIGAEHRAELQMLNQLAEKQGRFIVWDEQDMSSTYAERQADAERLYNRYKD